MKSLYLFIAYIIICTSTCLLYSSERPSSANKTKNLFTIQELNYNNQQEIDDIAQIFKDQTTSLQTGGIQPAAIRQGYSDFKKSKNFNESHIAKFNESHISLICKTPKNQVCGILLIKFDSLAAEYKTLAVHKDYRNKGIASALMQTAESVMPSSVEIAHLRVQHNNSDAIKFYQKQGFEINYYTKCTADCCATPLSFIPYIDTSIFTYGMVKELNFKNQKMER